MTRDLALSQSARLAAVQAPVIPIVGRWIAETPGTISLGQGVVGTGRRREAVAASQRFGATLERPSLRTGRRSAASWSELLEAKLARENGITGQARRAACW